MVINMNELDNIEKTIIPEIDKNFNFWLDEPKRAKFTRPCPFIIRNGKAYFDPEPFPDELDAEIISVKSGITNETK
jgi:hypothetical protein